MKKLLAVILAGVMALSMVACSRPTVGSVPEEKTVITVGCLAREEPDILFVAEQLKDSKYEIKPQIFSDVITTNMATAEGEIDANFIQNKKYLAKFNESNGTTLVAPGEPISTFPEGLYSRKYTSLEKLPDGATIAISNDTVNRARELDILAACGLIELDESVEFPTPLDVTSNPRNIEILEMESRSKWGAYDDVDCIVATAVTILFSDDPEKPSHLLAIEGMEVTMTVAGTSLVVAEGNEGAEWLQLMEEVMHTDAYAAHLAETYKGAKVPMYESDAFNVNYFEDK
jgi:D-methionine transport system substrate-binding protein